MSKIKGIIIRIDNDLSMFAWAFAVLIALCFGIYAGAKIMTGYMDYKIATIQSALDTTRASLAEANEEMAFWRNTVVGLSNGDQLEGVGMK